MDEFIPSEFFLSQNYPNPFRGKTIIKYCVAYKTKVQIVVYDSEGKVIEKLVDEEKQPGTYEVEFPNCHSWENRNSQEGTYFYRLEAEDFVHTKKMILLK